MEIKRLIDAEELLNYGSCPNGCNGTPTCMKPECTDEFMHCPIRVFDTASIRSCPTVHAYTQEEVIAMLEEIRQGVRYELHNGKNYADQDRVEQCISNQIKALEEKTFKAKVADLRTRVNRDTYLEAIDYYAKAYGSLDSAYEKIVDNLKISKELLLEVLEIN